MSEVRWDIQYGPNDEVRAVLHYCRELGCYGANRNHGLSWDDVRKEISEYYLGLSEDWQTMPDKFFK